MTEPGQQMSVDATAEEMSQNLGAQIGQLMTQNTSLSIALQKAVGAANSYKQMYDTAAAELAELKGENNDDEPDDDEAEDADPPTPITSAPRKPRAKKPANKS